jgi:hypothetical protein
MCSDLRVLIAILDEKSRVHLMRVDGIVAEGAAHVTSWRA